MPAYRDKRTGRWRFRKQVEFPDGSKERICGTPARDTRRAAEEAEREAIDRVLTEHRERQAGIAAPRKEEVPTFSEWFSGRFWREWVVGRKNKPSEVRSKTFIYECHLEAVFGSLRLDEIRAGEVASFRASLVEKGLSEKRINNILAVLSKSLKYAAEIEMIARAPRIGLFKVERPEIEAWMVEEYARLLRAALLEGPDWYAAVCLAGEAGLRTGEVRALRWREDVDLVAGTITINLQTCDGVTTTPKGRTRRTIGMTATLEQALRRMDVIREGLVVRDGDGAGYTDSVADKAMRRMCRRAGLPEQGWHKLRHSFGNHAALFGVNPWKLMQWMGHKRIDETMLYVHLAENHRRDTPPEVIAAAQGEADPDRRILRMLGARGNVVATARAAEDRTAVRSTG